MNDQQFFPTAAALDLKLSRRAFQNRFPPVPGTMAATKYDAMSMFLTDAAYAAELVPDAAARTALKLDIQAGLNRMAVAADVDYAMPDAANFTYLLMQDRIPDVFQLTAEERDTILSHDIRQDERP